MTPQQIIASKLADLDTEVGNIHALLASLKDRAATAREHAAMHNDASAGVELTRLRAQQTEAQGRLDAVQGLRNRVTKWLEHSGPVDMSIYKLTPPRSLDALQEEIGKTRAKLYDLTNELGEVKRAPQPIENLREQVVAYVARISKEGAPTISVAGGRLDISFDERRPFKYMAWLSPDEMVEKIVAHIKELQAQNGRKPMTIAARDAKIAKLTDAIDETERRETALVEAARAAGLTNVLHRPDISVAAFLGVKGRHKLAA